jgi:uncharacterized protein
VMRIRKMDCGSAANGRLAVGCEHCIKGSKMVLFVSGICGTGCFYCPVSLEKKDRDVVYANEMQVTAPEEIIAEAEAMDATGTGITGGDPLMSPERTIRVIRLLKERFGDEHHIHLYTSTMDPALVKKVADAGLDEIRFHPSPDVWAHMERTPLAEIVRTCGIDVGIEVPALPGHDADLDALIKYAESAGVRFVNLNELEFSESNWNMMGEHGYGLKDEISSAVSGSEEVAHAMLKRHRKANVHFCSSAFKDGVQLRNRLIRRAEHIAEEYEIVTEDGTLIRGLLYADDLDAAMDLLSGTYEVPAELMAALPEKGCLAVAPWILEELAGELPYKCYLSETYPTADGLEIERTPLK